MAGVKYFECREEGHKCRECPVWKKRKNEEKVAHMVKPQKAQQEKRLAHPIRGKAQKGERRLRRAEEEEAVCVTRPQEVQQGEWRRSSWEQLRKRAEKHCGEGIPEEAQLLELGWYVLGIIVIYTNCRRCRRKGSYVEDNRGQGVLQDRTFWCGYKRKKSSAPVREPNSVLELSQLLFVQRLTKRTRQSSRWIFYPTYTNV